MILRRLAGFFRRLLGETQGSSLVFVAAAIIPLVGFVGLGTDAARGYLVKARLNKALDAAGLAGAQNVYDTTLLEQDIQMFFSSNFPSGYMDATVTGPTYTYDAVNDKLVVTASAEVPTTFMRVLGYDSMVVATSTEVTRKSVYMDVVLAIDISGSMASSAGSGKTRLEAVRDSATTLVNILFGPSETKDLLKVGLVPFNSKVKVWTQGQTFYSTLTTTQTVPTFKNPVTGANQSTVYFANNSPVPLLSWPPSSWAGCVYARFTNDGIENDGDVVEGSLSSPQGDWVAWEIVGAEGEPQPASLRCSSAPYPYECTECPAHGITPLGNSKSAILAKINELQTPGGATDIPQGLAWAWRVLTPGAPYTEADPDPDGERIQAIVLLTDGENFGYPGHGYKNMWSAWGIGTPQPQMDARLLKLAANLKAEGVVVYVIQFADNSAALQNLLKQVATEPDAPYYHFAPDSDSLQLVFTEIANHLSELRLSK
jgi:Mg-chelatase subunit ChlD